MEELKVCLEDLFTEEMKNQKITQCDLEAYTGFDRKMFTEIKHGHIPRKTNVVTLCIVFGFDLEKAARFLHYAGYVLCDSIESDRRYIECLAQIKGSGLKRLLDCNEYLKAKGLDKKYYLGSVKE